MTGIADADLASIRTEAEKYLAQKATIRRKLVQSDGRGGQIEDWYDLAVNVPYRMDAPVGDEGPRGDRLAARVAGRAKFPYDTDLEPSDEVVDEATLELFEVTYVQKTPFDAYRQADLARA